MVQQTKVFVGSLPQGSRPEELRKLFERFGAVAECDVMNRIGFVHMETEEQAAAAIRALHNSTFNGGVITVEPGRIKERGQRGGGFGGGRGGRGGGMRGGGDRRGGGPMRGGGRGPPRDAPYMRDRGMGGGMGGRMGGGGMGMRNGGGMGGGYDRGGADYNDRYNGYGGGATGGYEDRRGFSMSQDPYSAAPAPYDEPRGYGAAPVDDMYGDDRRGGGYGDDRAPMRGSAMGGGYDRAPRQGGMGMGGGYDRGAPRADAAGGGYDMYSRRPVGGGGAGGYERDAYAAPQYNSGPRMGGGGGRGGGGGMGRRY